MGVGMGRSFDPFKTIRKLAGSYTDEKIVLARKLARDGYTYEQMAPLLGYNTAGSVRNYFKVNNLPKPDNRHGPVLERAESQKQAQSQRMKKYWENHTVHPNTWRGRNPLPSKPKTGPFSRQVKAKDGAMKITLPEWAEEAAKLRADGMSGPAIAKKLGVSDAYVYTTLNIISGKGTTRVPWAQDAIKAASEGKTNKEIGQQFGVTANRVRDVLAQHQASVQYRKNKEIKEATEVSMTDRKFEPTHQTDNGLTRNGVLIRCGVDGCHKVERFIRSHGVVNPVQAAQYFRAKGWIIGGGPRADRCPEHGYNKKTAEPVKKEDMSPFHPGNNTHHVGRENKEAHGIVNQAPAETVTAIQDKNEVAHDNAVAALVEEHEEAKKEMSKADRRIIFNKIEDVYGDETIGYKGDWSDEKVSEDLGVSVEWVALIREENFGPARNQALALAETRKAGEEVLAQITKIEVMKAGIEELSKSLQEKLGEYIAIKADYEARTEAFRELYKTIAK
jgi:transposase